MENASRYPKALRCLVKGTHCQPTPVALAGLPVVLPNEPCPHPGACYMIVTVRSVEEEARIIRWMSDHERPPYPIGALLFFQTVREAGHV